MDNSYDEFEDPNFDSSEIQADFKAELNELEELGGELLEKPRVYCTYEDCGKSYAYPSGLNGHIQSKHLGRKYPCTFCGKSYAYPQSLYTHIQSEHLGQIFPCTVDGCEYKATQAVHLKTHMQSVHRGLKPHKCTECEYEATQATHLKTHMQSVHRGLKPHKCTECEYEATQATHLKTHMQSVHRGLKPHQCTDCVFVCTTSGTLKKHIQSVHQGIPQHYKQCEHNVRAQQCTYCRARCQHCLLEPCSRSVPKWASTKLCIRCYYHLNPTLKRARRYLIKQKWVTADILNAFPNYSWVIDMPVERCQHGRRPDLLLDLGFIVLIIEIDEDAHRGENYSEMCEHARYNEIYTTLQYRPLYIIRFNPDKYTSMTRDLHGRTAAGVTYKSVFRESKDGYGVTAAYAQRLVVLIAAIQECLNMEHTAADFKCIFLFYE